MGAEIHEKIAGGRPACFLQSGTDQGIIIMMQGRSSTTTIPPKARSSLYSCRIRFGFFACAYCIVFISDT